MGIEIQTYCAIIACMLISLWTGRKPTLRTYEMICYYFTGLAEEDELLAHLAKLPSHDRLIQTRCHLLGRRGVRCCAPLAFYHLASAHAHQPLGRSRSSTPRSLARQLIVCNNRAEQDWVRTIFGMKGMKKGSELFFGLESHERRPGNRR